MSSWWVPSPAAIAPNSVRGAGRHHDAARRCRRARPCPSARTRSARPARCPAGTAVGGLRPAGSDSPVSTDSSHSRPVTASSRRSAGTMSPSRRSTTSPGTSVGDVHRRSAAVADAPPCWCRICECSASRGLLGAVLVDEPEPDRHGEDHADDHRVAALADEVGRDRGGQQQAEQRRAQLVPEHRQQPRPVRGHGVGPPLGLPRRDILIGQSLFGDAQVVQHVRNRLCRRGFDLTEHGRRGRWRRRPGHRLFRTCAPASTRRASLAICRSSRAATTKVRRAAPGALMSASPSATRRCGPGRSPRRGSRDDRPSAAGPRPSARRRRR